MTAGRSARTSAEVILQATAPKAQAARTSAEVILQASAPKAQVARVSAEVILFEPPADVDRWGVPWR